MQAALAASAATRKRGRTSVAYGTDFLAESPVPKMSAVAQMARQHAGLLHNGIVHNGSTPTHADGGAEQGNTWAKRVALVRHMGWGVRFSLNGCGALLKPTAGFWMGAKRVAARVMQLCALCANTLCKHGVGCLSASEYCGG